MSGTPEYQFQDVRGAVRLSDGIVVVADRGAQNLRWYDASGQHLSTAGRRGEGPGEFSGLLSVFTHRDTVVAFDERLQRVSVYSAAGEFVRSFQIPTRPGDLKGVFGDGSFLLGSVLGERIERAEGYLREMRATFHLGSSGEVLDTLPSFPNAEEVIRSISSGGRTAVISAPPPFGKRTVFAVHGDRFAVGDQTRPQLRILGPAGEPLLSLDWEDSNRAVTDRVLEEHQAYQLGLADGPEAERQTRQMLAEETYPDSLPAHGRILFDPDGNLWVEAYQLPGQGAIPWTVYDPRGNQLGRVSVPERLIVYEVGREHVLGMSWDEFDVEYVHLYGLVEPGG
jgi:hypothetical protein